MANQEIDQRAQELFQPVLNGLEQAREKAEIGFITDEIDAIIGMDPADYTSEEYARSRWQSIEIKGLEEGENAFVEFRRTGATNESPTYTIYGAIYLKGTPLRTDRIASISKAGVLIAGIAEPLKRHDSKFSDLKAFVHSQHAKAVDKSSRATSSRRRSASATSR